MGAVERGLVAHEGRRLEEPAQARRSGQAGQGATHRVGEGLDVGHVEPALLHLHAGVERRVEAQHPLGGRDRERVAQGVGRSARVERGRERDEALRAATVEDGPRPRLPVPGPALPLPRALHSARRGSAWARKRRKPPQVGSVS